MSAKGYREGPGARVIFRKSGVPDPKPGRLDPPHQRIRAKAPHEGPLSRKGSPQKGGSPESIRQKKRFPAAGPPRALPKEPAAIGRSPRRDPPNDLFLQGIRKMAVPPKGIRTMVISPKGPWGHDFPERIHPRVISPKGSWGYDFPERIRTRVITLRGSPA